MDAEIISRSLDVIIFNIYLFDFSKQVISLNESQVKYQFNFP